MKLFFVTYSFVLVVLATCLLYLEVESETIYNIMLGCYLIQVFFFIATIKQDNPGKMQYLRPFFILLLGMTIVNFQVIIDTLYGSFRTELIIWRLERYLGQCLYLGIIAQTSLTIGFVYNNRSKNIKIQEKNKVNHSILNLPKYIWGGILILLFALFILTIDVQAFLIGDSSVNDGSFDREVGTMALYSELILNAFFVIIISSTTYVFSKSEDKSLKRFVMSFPALFWVVFIVYLFLRLLSGDRGPVMYNMVTLLFAYVYASKRIFSFIPLAVLLVIAAFGITIIGIARKKDSTIPFETKIVYAIEEFKKSDTQSYIPITQELANSVKLTALGIRGIEQGTIERGYGRYNLMQWRSTVPFSSRILYTLFPSFRQEKFTTSEVLTVEGLGKQYTYGLGNTAIAEIYIDFGILGIPVLFFLFGYIYRKVDDVIVLKKNVSPYLLTFALYMSSHAIYIGRSSFSFIMANACLYMLIQYLLAYFIRFIYVKK